MPVVVPKLMETHELCRDTWRQTGASCVGGGIAENIGWEISGSSALRMITNVWDLTDEMRWDLGLL